MRNFWWVTLGAIAIAITAGWFVALPAQAPGSLNLEPIRESGQSVTGAFEGWYQNPDGTYSLLMGYFNRNSKEILDGEEQSARWPEQQPERPQPV